MDRKKPSNSKEKKAKRKEVSLSCNPFLFSHQGFGVFSSFEVAANYYLRITILGL